MCLPLLLAQPWRGGRHQLSPTFPRSPGIIPVALSKGFSGLRSGDCSIKERGRACESRRKVEANVRHHRLTAESGE